MLPVFPKETASMFTRDGVRLDADLYRPDAAGPFPILLMRQPYGRSIASTVVYAHPSWYAAQGYIVVIQDVRGRGTSDGSFTPFATEIEDGYDTVEWAAALPNSTGQVGMYGFSYQGMTQLYAASLRPAALKTLCPAMMAYDLYQDMAYEGGAFHFQATLGWAIQLATETARLQGDQAAYQALFRASRNLPLYDSIPAQPEVLRHYAPDSFYFDWLNNPDPTADYWQKLSPSNHMQAVDLPMLHIGGWFDTYLRGTLGLHQEMIARSTHPQHLIIGPWSHLPWGRKVGSVDFGSAAVNPIDRLQIQWFDQILKGLDTGLFNTDPVQLFEMGSNRWSTFKIWPQPKPESMYLFSSGLACMSEAEGLLVKDLPAPCPNDVFVHDPWRPVPALGGHAAAPAGSFDRSALDCRTDVLTYTSNPFDEDISIAGVIKIELYCFADQPSFDLCVVLSEVRSGGVYNLTQGYKRIHLGQDTLPVQIDLQPICAQIAKGNALRLSISAACFPAYLVNPGTGSKPAETTLIDSQIITITVKCGGETRSRILLPIRKDEPQR